MKPTEVAKGATSGTGDDHHDELAAAQSSAGSPVTFHLPSPTAKTRVCRCIDTVDGHVACGRTFLHVRICTPVYPIAALRA